MNSRTHFDEDDIDEDEPKQNKIRKRNPDNWKQNVRKRNRNKGLEYIKANGKVGERKKLGPPCTCKEKCYLRIGLDACEKIFRNFWKLGDHALQNAYIAGCVRIFLPKNCCKKGVIPSRRFFSRNFYVNVNGVDTEVCKQAFLNMHAISNGRLDRLLKKKQEIGNTGFDERGRHTNKVNKIPFEKINLVCKHIDTIRQKAGYTGKRKPKKIEILPGILNVRTMYRSYKEEMALKGLEPVCEYRYRKIFHTHFHLDFGKTIMPCDSVPVQRQKLLKRQSETLKQLTPQFGVSVEKPSIDVCERNIDDTKDDKLMDLMVQEANLSLRASENVNCYDETSSSPLQSEKEDVKELQTRAPEQTSYVLSHEIYELGYSTGYSGPQQNWIFSNSN